MALSSALRYVDLTLECELCGFLMIKTGVWFWTASTFKCQECKGKRRLTYSDKVALFAKHSHLALAESRSGIRAPVDSPRPKRRPELFAQ
jgi:hypothetical protein